MARQQKLKVFRAPIGFHDVYVAAPSRKAALEARGSDHDLFARGMAEEVVDPELIREPLARPGEIIRDPAWHSSRTDCRLCRKPRPKSPTTTKAVLAAAGEAKNSKPTKPSQAAETAAGPSGT